MQELYTILKSTGLPVAYGSFREPTSLPFITYQYNSSNDVYLDNKNAVTKGIWQVELYTEEKNRALEKELENTFRESGLTYTKYEAWIDDEKMWQEVYLIELLEGDD